MIENEEECSEHQKYTAYERIGSHIAGAIVFAVSVYAWIVTHNTAFVFTGALGFIVAL